MARKLVCLLLSVGLVAMFAACSDDDEKPKDAFVYPDAGPDGPVPDTAPDMAPTEGGTDIATDVETDIPAAAQYSILLGLVEYVGKTSPNAPTARIGKYLANVSRSSPADPLNKPDFIDNPAPPNCSAYKWTATTPPLGNAWDAGKLTITGHVTGATSVYIDYDDMGASCTPACTPPQYCKTDGTCGTPSAIPATIELTRGLVAGTTNQYQYTWNLPSTTILPGASFFDANTKLTMAAAGGADIPAWSIPNVAVGAAPTLKSTTDLTALDPAAIKIEWDGTLLAGTALVAISIQAHLADDSEGVNITCSTLAVAGSKDIPAAALALIPTPGTTADKALVIQTAVLGMTITGPTETWGSASVGAGQGVLGVTCRTPTGVVPCPD
jgi:hypothetical protein